MQIPRQGLLLVTDYHNLTTTVTRFTWLLESMNARSLIVRPAQSANVLPLAQLALSGSSLMGKAQLALSGSSLISRLCLSLLDRHQQATIMHWQQKSIQRSAAALLLRLTQRSVSTAATLAADLY